MPKVFIDHIESAKRHVIFTGKNALKYALYFERTGETCRNESILYHMDISWLKGVWWDANKKEWR